MKNGIFTLNWASVASALLTAIITAVIGALYIIVTTAGFNVFTSDWVMIGKDMVNIGVITGVVSLWQDFISTKSGSVLGITPSNN